MKKNNLFALSGIALAAACGLVSCNNSGEPYRQPDVYFTAQAAIITVGENGESKFQEVDFKNTECATIEVKDKDKLKYGKQDVEITIKPKPSFTFREYNPGDWEPLPTAAPMMPYVGLGNPHTLYSYELPFGTAWTFENQTSEENGEQYKITVKKDFFKKNIVIDYGNKRKNNVLTYKSLEYETMFAKAISKEDGDECFPYYRQDVKHSSFLAASKGITVTYEFSANNELYSFEGWDKELFEEPESNDGEEVPYAHFQILGYNTENEDGHNIATHTSGVQDKDQLFVPTVVGNKLSFFINWSLLKKSETPEANGTRYEPLYNKIKVILGSNLHPEVGVDPDYSPSIKTNVSVHWENDEEPEELLVDGYAQYSHDGSQEKLSSSKVIGKASDGNYATFEEIDVEEKASDRLTPDYAVLFTVKKKAQVICHLGEDGGDTIDTANEPMQANWRKEKYKETDPGETSLNYWPSRGNKWYLVHLNPDNRTSEHLPEKYRKSTSVDVYYLYSNGKAPFVNSDDEFISQYDITIELGEAPEPVEKFNVKLNLLKN